jgi:ATP-dependent RNA helicase RhlE
MLDMGFIHDVRRIIAAVPRKRQTLFFSATMPAEIRSLADNILSNPVQVAVTPIASTVDTIQQSVFFVEKKDKAALLEHLLGDRAIKRVLVFTRTKHGANKVVTQLERSRIQAEAIHGNKSQSARERALANFKNGNTRVLVATDIAARGLDVDDITHVINYDLPNEPETYVHRIGRTARAGASGVAYSFCDNDERAYLRDIERLIRLRVPAAANHPYSNINGHTAPTHSNGAQAPESSNGSAGQSRFQPKQQEHQAQPNGSPMGDKKRRRRRRPSNHGMKRTA